MPLDVVERAEVVSKDFASKFKEKMEGKRKKNASARLPIDAQADFTFLYGLVTGTRSLDANLVRQREVLQGLKLAVTKCLQSVSST